MHKKLIKEYVCPYTRKNMSLEDGIYEVMTSRMVDL